MSDAVLEIRGLTKTYAAGGGLLRAAARATVVEDVSFDVRRGGTFGLVGESGSGKSTIARLALRLIEADAGAIRFDGTDIRAADARALKRLRRRIQIVFQDPFSSLDPRVRIGRAIAEPIRLHGLRPPGAIRDRVVELLETVGLGAPQADRFPHEFSGGQRQRIAIARALAVEPDLIVCDEAVSALDVSIQAQILNLLADLQARLGVSLLFISHDMAVVRHLATDVGVLYAGRLVESGPAPRVFGDPRHPYTRGLLAATPNPVPGARAATASLAGEPPSPFAKAPGCAFVSRCPDRIGRCETERPPADAFSAGGRVAACWRSAGLDARAALSDSEALMSPAYRLRIGLVRDARARADA